MNANKQITDYFKKEYGTDMAETAIFLAEAFVKETNADWNTDAGRKKIIQHVRDYCDEGTYSSSSRTEILKSDDDTFLQAFSEGLDETGSYTPDDFDKDDGDEHAGGLAPASSGDTEDTIDTKKALKDKGLHELPFEASEVLKKIDSEAYESPALNNITRLGVLKQFRKAMIMLWVARNKAPNVENQQV